LLNEFIATCLGKAEAVSGGAEAFRNMYLAQADSTVLNQIKEELTRG
jgi:hypothetical protein